MLKGQQLPPVEYFENFNLYVNIDDINRLYEQYHFSTESGKQRAYRMIMQIYAQCQMLKARSSKPGLIVPERSDGEIVLGNFFQHDREGGECRISFDDISHTTNIAMVGMGKTTLQFNMIESAYTAIKQAAGKTNFIIWDKKQDYRALDIGQLVLSATKGDFGIQLFEPPPGVDRVAYQSDIVELLMHTGKYFFASRNTLVLTLESLHKDLGGIPNFFDLQQKLKEEYEYDRNKSYRRTEILEVLIDRGDSLIRQAGAAISAEHSLALEELCDEGISLVLEADVSPDVYQLLTAWSILYLYHYRKAAGIRGNVSVRSGTICVMDEAHYHWDPMLTYSDSRKETGASIIERAPLLMRDFSISIMALSPMPLSSEIQSTSRLRIVGHVGDARHMKDLAANLGDAKLVEIIPKLGVGEFIVKVRDMKPALVRARSRMIVRPTDEEIQQKMEAMVKHIRGRCFPERPQELQEKRKPKVILSDKMIAILHSINSHPYWYHSQRLKAVLKSANSNAKKVIDDLEAVGYIKVVQFDGRKYHVPLQPGVDWMRDNGLNVSHINFQGNQTPMHKLLLVLVSSALRARGFNIFHDHKIGNKIIDVFCDGIAYEVYLKADVNADNLKSALSAGVEKFVMVCLTDQIMEALSKQLPPSDKVEYRLATEIVEKLRAPMLDSILEKSEKQVNHTDNDDNSTTDNKAVADGQGPSSSLPDRGENTP